MVDWFPLPLRNHKYLQMGHKPNLSDSKVNPCGQYCVSGMLVRPGMCAPQWSKLLKIEMHFVYNAPTNNVHIFVRFPRRTTSLLSTILKTVPRCATTPYATTNGCTAVHSLCSSCWCGSWASCCGFRIW